MNDRERFLAVMNYRPYDRLPVYWFDLWKETLARWRAEGLRQDQSIAAQTGMDEDWEAGLWGNHGLANPRPLSDAPAVTVEETATYAVIRSPLGGLAKHSTAGSSIPQHLEEDLRPTREDWRRFQRFLDPSDPRRRPPGWQEQARAFDARQRVACFFAGSLFGRLREWMGTEAISYLAYDDPGLYEDMIACQADFYMAVNGPLLEHCRFEMGYFFEDCCFNGGPLLSPAIFQKHYARHYRRMIDFYRSKGVPLLMMDSDGKVDALVGGWLEAGIDVLFPIEVGTWKASPAAFRQRFGRRLRMFGGVDKHVIPRGAAAVRAALTALKAVVDDGGYIPIPDHRLPPDCSLEDFRTYVRVFHEVFNSW